MPAADFARLAHHYADAMELVFVVEPRRPTLVDPWRIPLAELGPRIARILVR